MKKLNSNQQHLIKTIIEQWEKYPQLRFGQLLFNMNINQFADEIIPENKDHLLRDIYNDTDVKILKRIKAF